jgi:putative ABC transport system ATP-binding protein
LFYILAYKSSGFIDRCRTISEWKTSSNKFENEIDSNKFENLVYTGSEFVISIFDKLITSKLFLFFVTFPPGIMILLYFNMSAKLQKGKIGILRSLGSNGINVGKIFVVEGFIFALIQTFLIFVLTLFLYPPIFPSIFSSYTIQPIAYEDINNRFVNHMDSLDKFIQYTREERKAAFLDKNNSNYCINFMRNIFCPFLIWNPILRVLYFILLNFSFIFFLTIFFTSFIIYKWSTKKPIDILNNR